MNSYKKGYANETYAIMRIIGNGLGEYDGLHVQSGDYRAPGGFVFGAGEYDGGGDAGLGARGGRGG